jgi:hypothetical protein
MACQLCGNATRDLLCGRHCTELTESLADLPGLYAEVGEFLVPRQSGWGDIVTSRAAPGPRSPINEDILDNINWGRASEVMRLWRTDVRRVRWPHRGDPPAGSLADDCRWLARESAWIAANYPAVGDLAREVATLASEARRIVGDPAPRRKVVGRCITVTDDRGTRCGADITHKAGESELVCDTCHGTYRSETDLLLLLHFQRELV